jgi:dihydroorotate dehydrogenase
MTDSWRCSRADMLVLLNQVSYRSMLALYLFAQTPVPVGILKEEELGGITGPVCMHTALMHIQKMRQRCNPGKPFKRPVTRAHMRFQS